MTTETIAYVDNRPATAAAAQHFNDASALADALRAVVEAIEFTPLGVRALHALTEARKALAAAEDAT